MWQKWLDFVDNKLIAMIYEKSKVSFRYLEVRKTKEIACMLLETFGIEVKKVYNEEEAVEDVRITPPGHCNECKCI